MKIVIRDPSKGYVDNWLWVPKAFIQTEQLKKSLTITFSGGYSADENTVVLWDEAPNHLLVPRALWDVGQLPYPVIDCRPQTFPEVDFQSDIRLDHLPYTSGGVTVLRPTGDNVQTLSFKALSDAMGGTLQLACGKGKTVIALQHITMQRMPALIVVDNSQLLHQWAREIERHMQVPGGVGNFHSGIADWEGRGIVLATYQTLSNKAATLSEDFRRYFGATYYDEGHHVSATNYSKCVTTTYGKRFSLTATPTRSDGQHIIAKYHIGNVLHKDMRPTMKPNIYFFWTGFKLDPTDPKVQAKCYSVLGELHRSKIQGYFGQWRERLWMILQQAYDAVHAGRKILILSNSVDEVVNLMTLWTRGAHAPLFTDQPEPTIQDINETTQPLMLDKLEAKKLHLKIKEYWLDAESGKKFRSHTWRAIDRLMEEWQQYLIYKRLESLQNKRRKAFLKKLVAEPSTAGILTYGVSPEMRMHFLDTRPLVFGITKYGKEGLDCPTLDTVGVSTPFSDRNMLTQLMNRPTRIRPGKRTPIVFFCIDNVGLMRGSEDKLMKHLRAWPSDEGGTYAFELVNYPELNTGRKTCPKKTMKEAFLL